GHAGEDGQWEVPRGDDDGHAARLVEVVVVFAGHVAGDRLALEFRSFDGVVFAEVDGLSDVGVGLAPRLARFEHDPGGEFEAAAAELRSGAAEQVRSGFYGGIAPG